MTSRTIRLCKCGCQRIFMPTDRHHVFATRACASAGRSSPNRPPKIPVVRI